MGGGGGGGGSLSIGVGWGGVEVLIYRGGGGASLPSALLVCGGTRGANLSQRKLSTS